MTPMSELAEPSAAPDGLQRPLLRRVRFQPQVSAGVGQTEALDVVEQPIRFR